MIIIIEKFSFRLMALKTTICLSFIVLNNFFANMCVKKNCASPTKSLTARHWTSGMRTAEPVEKRQGSSSGTAIF